MKKFSYKEIIIIAMPILVSLLMEQLIGMTDTAFLGRIGETELAASALASVYFLALFMLALGFSVGAQILMGQYNGAREYEKIGGVFYQGCYFLLGFAVLLFGLSRSILTPILANVVQSQSVYQAMISYLDWRSYGFFFAFLGTMFRAFFVGTTLTRTLTLNSIVMVLSNILFNYLLIFGKWGFPQLGIAGAAIGSSLAEGVSLLFFILYTRSRIDLAKFGLNRIPAFSFSELRLILKLSFWTMLQNSISVAVWFIFFLSIERMGERALAISNIVRSLSAFPFMVVASFGATVSTLVSNLIGAGQIKAVGKTIRQVIIVTYLMVAPILVGYFLYPSLFLNIYSDSEALINASIPALWVLASCYIFGVPAKVYIMAIAGTGRTRTAMIIELSVLTIYLLYLYFIVNVLRADVALCWTTEHIYFGFTLLFSYLYLKRKGEQYFS